MEWKLFRPNFYEAWPAKWMRLTVRYLHNDMWEAAWETTYPDDQEGLIGTFHTEDEAKAHAEKWVSGRC